MRTTPAINDWVASLVDTDTELAACGVRLLRERASIGYTGDAYHRTAEPSKHRAMIGTWRGREGRTLVSVRRGRPALRVTLEGERYRRLLLDVDDATATAAALAAA